MLYGNLQKYGDINKEEPENIIIRLFIDYLENNHANIKDSKKNILLDLNRLSRELPLETRFVDNILYNYNIIETIINNAIINWCDKERDFFFFVDDKFRMPYFRYDKVNHLSLNKLLRFKGIVDSYQPFVGITYEYIFYCKTCGKTIKSKSPKIDCVCGNKKMKYDDRKFKSKMNFNLMETIKGNTSGFAPFYFLANIDEPDEYLFNESFVGEEVDLFAVPRVLDIKSKTEDKVMFVLELKAIKKLTRRKLSNTSKKEIIKTIQNDKDAFQKLAYSMSRKTYGLEELRELVFASVIGLNKPDPDFPEQHPAFNPLVIGDPSIGKSFTTKSFTKYFQKCFYIQGLPTTTSGLLGGTTKNADGTFTIRSGLVKRANSGTIIMDEIDKISDTTIKALFTALSEGKHTISSIAGTIEFKYNVNFVLLGNPKFGKFEAGTSKTIQCDFDPAMMSRCSVLLFPELPYLKEDGTLDNEKFEEFIQYRSGNKEYESDYDDEFLKDYAQIVKEQPNPILTPEIKKLMDIYQRNTKHRLHQQKDFEDVDLINKKGLDERFINAIVILSKIIARATFNNEVKPEHYMYAIKLIEKVMVEQLNRKGIDSLNVLQSQMTSSLKKKIPTSKKQKIDTINSFINPVTPISFIDLLEKCNDVGISETELDEYLKKAVSEGEIYKPRGDEYLEVGGNRGKH